MPYYMIHHIDLKSAFPGHAFTEIRQTDGAGNIVERKFYGKYFEGSPHDAFDAPALYKNDVSRFTNPDGTPNTDITSGTAHEISQNAYEDIRSTYDALVEASDIGLPIGDEYHFNGDNCADFQNDLHRRAGLPGDAEDDFPDADKSQSAVGHYMDSKYGDGSTLNPFTGLESSLSSAISAAGGVFAAAAEAASPIILDMDGDGIELVSLANSQTFFDIDHDQFAELTGWATGDDAFLARDLNGNGTIDHQGELFGDDGGSTAYQKLAALDTLTIPHPMIWRNASLFAAAH